MSWEEGVSQGRVGVIGGGTVSRRVGKVSWNGAKFHLVSPHSSQRYSFLCLFTLLTRFSCLRHVSFRLIFASVSGYFKCEHTRLRSLSITFKKNVQYFI